MFWFVFQEKAALAEKLSVEEDKIKELNKELVKLRSTVKIGQDAFAEEHKTRVALEEQLKVSHGMQYEIHFQKLI